jgi:hypothetical protein
VAALEGCGHRGGGRRLHQAREDLLADQRPFIFLRNVPKRVAREARTWLQCFSREAGWRVSPSAPKKADFTSARSSRIAASVPTSRHPLVVAAATSDLVVAEDVPATLRGRDDVVGAEVGGRTAIGAVRMPGDRDLPQLLVRRVVATLRCRALLRPATSGLLTLIGPAAFSVVVALRSHTAAVTA